MTILEGFSAIVDSNLKILDIGKPPHYSHKTSAKYLSQNPIEKFNSGQLFTELLECVEHNFKQSNSKTSEKNWRWAPQGVISVNNKSQEKIIEKYIVNKSKGENSRWANQVPTGSGLFNSNSDKKRAIDLVYKHSEKEFDFIELKIKSDNPLKAAIELIEYAVLYVFSRKNYTNTEIKKHILLQSEKIHLKVLAPHNYYLGYSLGWLANSFNIGLQHFLKDEPFKMDFQFVEFPSNFQLNDKIDDLEKFLESTNFMKILEARSPVSW